MEKKTENKKINEDKHVYEGHLTFRDHSPLKVKHERWVKNYYENSFKSPKFISHSRNKTHNFDEKKNYPQNFVLKFYHLLPL